VAGTTQLNGTTQINSAVIGNTTIGSAGGGTTTIAGTTTFQGNTTAVTQSGSDDTNKLATTAFAQERRLNILVGDSNKYSSIN
jgi:hypothetical protein